MATDRRPTLVLLAGPNGAGKSTLYETRIRPTLNAPFINADIIQREELGDSDMRAAYKAARLADERREACFIVRSSFVTETVFSHPSKLDLLTRARKLGYRIMVFHISVEYPDLSVARVQARVTEGGHDVPEEKIRNRYARNGSLIRKAVLLADMAHVFDNSRLNTPPRHLLIFERGRETNRTDNMPEWAVALYGERR